MCRAVYKQIRVVLVAELGSVLGSGGHFLDYCVAAGGAAHQTDPLSGEPAGDVPLPELLGTKLTLNHMHIISASM